VEGADKLLKLTVDTGEAELRQLVAGIAEAYSADQVVGRLVPVLINLAPKTIRGVQSQGMILCPSDDAGTPVLLQPDREVGPGAKLQ
jgi:methionine--tRNA ligase beta chain